MMCIPFFSMPSPVTVETIELNYITETLNKPKFYPVLNILHLQLGQGKILILTSDGNINHLIQFHEISLKFDSDDGKLSVKVRNSDCG